MIANNQQQLLPELVAFAAVGADGAGRPVSERMDAEVFPRFDETGWAGVPTAMGQRTAM